MNSAIKINNLPVPTWRWLKVNDKKVELPETVKAVEPKMTLGKTSELRESGLSRADYETGLGAEFDEYIKNTGLKAGVIAKKAGDTDPEYTWIKYNAEEDGAAVLDLVAEEGSVLNVFIYYSGFEGANGISDIRIDAADNAEVNLIEVFRLDKTAVFYDNIGAKLGKKASFNLSQIVVSGDNMNLGVVTDMIGDKSLHNIDFGYLRAGESDLDVNYVARQRGKLTESHMMAGGALRESAKKTFRGTIDFIRGCADSKGEVRDNVLLLSPDVVNRTVPLILCAEENVEGEHGASIGKVSDEELFYFESRGIPENVASELLAASKLEAVAGRIKDSRVREYVLSRVCRKCDEEDRKCILDGNE